ncbi:MAG: histidine kinase [Bacteroidota bacterium]
MSRKLINLALITSPIFAIYGLAPILLYSRIDWIHFIISFVVLAFVILLFWLFNIFLFSKELDYRLKYVLSYTFTFLLHIGNVYSVNGPNEMVGTAIFFIYVFLVAFAVNTLTLIIINFESIKSKKNIAESQLQQLKVVNLEAQQKVLTQQLQPHFLFNALSTLKSLIVENRDRSVKYVVQLSEFLRYSINIQRNGVVKLREELQFTNDFINLQKVRFGKALNWEVDVEEHYLNYKIPAFALQTLVENALKHNFFTIKKPLNIELKSTNQRLMVKNNKNPKPLSTGHGIGLKNLNERYQLTFNQAIEIIDTADHFSVYLTLSTDENRNH